MSEVEKNEDDVTTHSVDHLSTYVHKQGICICKAIPNLSIMALLFILFYYFLWNQDVLVPHAHGWRTYDRFDVSSRSNQQLQVSRIFFFFFSNINSYITYQSDKPCAILLLIVRGDWVLHNKRILQPSPFLYAIHDATINRGGKENHKSINTNPMRGGRRVITLK